MNRRGIRVYVIGTSCIPFGKSPGQVFRGPRTRDLGGEVCFTPPVRERRIREQVSKIAAAGGRATASMALYGAWKDVLSGQSWLSLSIGVERTFVPNDPQRTHEIFVGGIDQLDRDVVLRVLSVRDARLLPDGRRRPLPQMRRIRGLLDKNEDIVDRYCCVSTTLANLAKTCSSSQFEVGLGFRSTA